MRTIEDKNYLTVKEFAAAADISNKAVYQQLKTRLKEYSINVDGVTMIEEAALKAFYQTDSSVQVKSSQVDSRLESHSEDRYIAYLEQEIKELKEQLKEKDKTISEMQKQIISLSSESLQQIASITKNIQLLQVAEAKEEMIKSQEAEIIEQPKKSFWERMRGK